MALNTFKCNCLAPLHFKELNTNIMTRRACAKTDVCDLQMLFIVLDVDDEDVPRILTIVDDSARRDALPLIYFVQSDSTLAPSAAPRHRYRLDARAATTTVISQFIHDVLGGKIKVRHPIHIE